MNDQKKIEALNNALLLIFGLMTDRVEDRDVIDPSLESLKSQNDRYEITWADIQYLLMTKGFSVVDGKVRKETSRVPVLALCLDPEDWHWDNRNHPDGCDDEEGAAIRRIFETWCEENQLRGVFEAHDKDYFDKVTNPDSNYCDAVYYVPISSIAPEFEGREFVGWLKKEG